jgi:hypothetical protein
MWKYRNSFRGWIPIIHTYLYNKYQLSNYLTFKHFDIERTWWRLFQKRVVRSKFDIYVLIANTKFTNCHNIWIFYRVWENIYYFHWSLYERGNLRLYLSVKRRIILEYCKSEMCQWRIVLLYEAELLLTWQTIQICMLVYLIKKGVLK